MIKITSELESILNFIDTTYIKENDANLDEGALQLKAHYKYVIEDLILHNGLKED